MFERVGYDFIDQQPKQKCLVAIDQERSDVHLHFNILAGALFEVIDQPLEVSVDRHVPKFVVLIYVLMHRHHRADAARNALARFGRQGLKPHQ